MDLEKVPCRECLVQGHAGTTEAAKPKVREWELLPRLEGQERVGKDALEA